MPPGEEPKAPVKDINKELKEPAKEASPAPTPEADKPAAAASPAQGEPKPDAKAPTTMTIDFDGILGRAAPRACGC